MSWEPATLAEYCLEQRLLDQMRKDPTAIVDLLPSVDLGDYLHRPEPHLDEIHRLSGPKFSSGIELHPLLTPGPADISFVLTHYSGNLSDVLRELGHWDYPTVAFILQGGLTAKRIFDFEGYTFQQTAYAGPMHLTVIPARSEKEVIIDRGSLLLLGSPGSKGFATAIARPYLEPLRLRSIGPSLRPLLKGQDLAGSSIAIHRHRPDIETLRADHKGLLSIGLHLKQEPEYRAPDICVVAPGIEAHIERPRYTLDVTLA